VGLAMAQQLIQQQGGLTGAGAQPGGGGSGAAGAAAGFDLLSPADAAKLLGVSEGDVIASIDSGDLKAKKIGATYRITRAALQEFIHS
jgi:excisionase family DNA binding protein